ncbi:MAG: hypothetical protein U1F43_13805 [Myxococcota bacterium]
MPPTRRCAARARRVLVALAACALAACGDDDDLGPGDTSSADSASDAAPDARDDARDDVARWDRTAAPWPMFGGDPQRSGRSPFVGPSSVDEGASWRYEVVAGASVNMQPTLTAAGVFFGSWGIDRGAATADPATSRKSDGHYYGLDAAGHELFPPFDPAPLAACYRYDEAISAKDEEWCGAGNDLHVTFYNGTIEGTGLVDPWNGRHYVGRGDGRLYALDTAPSTDAAARVVWSFATFDPTEPQHPDGGGEIVGGPAMGPDGTLYFATYGLPYPAAADAPLRETQAVYAVSRDGALVWRYPSASPSLDNTVVAAVALAPDGATVYVATWLSDTKVPGRLLALDATAPASTSDAQRLRWSLALANADRPGSPALWTRHVSVGADGTVFLGCAESRFLGFAAAVVAVGPGGSIQWIAEPHGYADAATTLVQGLALGDGVLFASTGDPRDLDGKQGLLAALDPADGAVLATFDPDDDAAGSMTGPLLDAGGHVYVGTRGRHDYFAEPFAAGSQWRHGVMFGIAWDAGAKTLSELWRRPADFLLDWATPALDAHGVLYYGSTAPLPIDTAATRWKPLSGTPPRTSTWFYAVSDGRAR